MGERERRKLARDLRSSGKPCGPPRMNVTWCPSSSHRFTVAAKVSESSFGPIASRTTTILSFGIAASIFDASETIFWVNMVNFFSRSRKSSPIAVNGPFGSVPTVMRVIFSITANISRKMTVYQEWIDRFRPFLTVFFISYTISRTFDCAEKSDSEKSPEESLRTSLRTFTTEEDIEKETSLKLNYAKA